MKPSRACTRTFLHTLAIGVAIAGGCGLSPKPVFVAGPETHGLRASFAGYIVTIDPDVPWSIISLSLPDLKRAVVYQLPGPGQRRDFPYIHSTAGPDEQGRVAFVEGEMDSRRHRLKVVSLDGGHPRELFDRPGDALWDHVIGKHLAMSAGGKIAFVSKLHGVQMPEALLQEGALEVWDLDQGSARTVATMVLDKGLSWFPDGQRLAYVALVQTERVPAPPEASDGFIAAMPGWDRHPVVFVLDLRTGESSMVHAGWDAVVGDDGRSLFITDGPQHETHARRVWLNREAAPEPVTGPSEWIIAMKADGTVLFVAPPTEGSSISYTKGYSPLAGPRQLPALKVGILNTSKFETVMQAFDFRNTVSFGKVALPGVP